jgi:hypothetical protein
VRLVADESCDFSVVVALRRVGHDTVAIAETMSGADDDKVIALANSDERLLITEDKDFGRLVFAAARAHSGVILIRYPATARTGLTADASSWPSAEALYMAALPFWSPEGLGWQP